MKNSNINPRPASQSYQLYIPSYERRMSKWWWVLPVLVLPIALLGSFDFVSQQRAATAVAQARLVPSDHLRSFLNTGRLLKTSLYAGSSTATGADSNYAYIRLDQHVMTTGRHVGTMVWQDVESAPRVITFSDKSKLLEVKLDVIGFDTAHFPVIFEDFGANRDKADVSDSWKKLMNVPERRYRLRALRSGTKVTLAGTFWRQGSDVFVRNFAYKGVGETKYVAPVHLNIDSN